MRRILAFLFFVSGYCVYGQTLENKHHRVLILLDASLSMNEPTGGYATKYAAASDFIIRLMDSIYHRNDEVEFGLRVYGHQYPANARQCFDTKLEVQFSRDNIEQMKMRLADVKPRGISNTYSALKEAVEYDISSVNNYVYHILIITDGGDACNDKDIYTLNDLLKYKQVPYPCTALLDDKKPFNCYTENTKLLTKENNNMLLGCLAIPEHYKKRVTTKVATVTEAKPIQKTTIATKPKQSVDKQFILTTAPTDSLKPIPLASAENRGEDRSENKTPEEQEKDDKARELAKALIPDFYKALYSSSCKGCSDPNASDNDGDGNKPFGVTTSTEKTTSQNEHPLPLGGTLTTRTYTSVGSGKEGSLGTFGYTFEDKTLKSISFNKSGLTGSTSISVETGKSNGASYSNTFNFSNQTFSIGINMQGNITFGHGVTTKNITTATEYTIDVGKGVKSAIMLIPVFRYAKSVGATGAALRLAR